MEKHSVLADLKSERIEKSICNAINWRDYKSLNSKRLDCKSVRTRASRLQLSVPPLWRMLEGGQTYPIPPFKGREFSP